jgi:hypothetical protein
MEKKYSLTLDKEFVQFCQLNGILEVEKLAGELLQKAFTEYKFGRTPKASHPEKKDEVYWKTCGVYPMCQHYKCECREDHNALKTIERIIERKKEQKEHTPPTPITTKPKEEDLYGE